MAKQLAKKLACAGNASIFNTSGLKGVCKTGSSFAWRYNGRGGFHQKGGFETAEEAAYFYDEFLVHHIGPDADTNQALGLLKPKQVLEIREKLKCSEKAIPRSKSGKVGATGYKGVSKHKSVSKPFKAQIARNGKYLHIGTYTTAEEAARAYDAMILKLDGAAADTNVKLGLIPPLGADHFDPRQITPKTEQVNMHAAITPLPFDYDERQRQIEEARRMAANEPAEILDVEASATGADITRDSSTSVPDFGQTTPEDSNTSKVETGEYLPAVAKSAATLREQAAALLQRAAEVEANTAKDKLAAMLEELTLSVQGYQAAVDKLVDHGADIERQLAKLKTLI